MWVTRWIQQAVVLHISRMSSQPPPAPPALAFHGHPQGFFPRMLGGAQFGIQEGRGASMEKTTQLLEARAHLGAGRNFKS